MQKYCSRCKQEKDIKEFSSNKGRHDGFATYCKHCTRGYDAQHYYQIHERKLVAGKKYYQANKDKWRKKKEVAKARHPEKFAARAKVRAAVFYGKIARKPCERCGEPKSHAHHEDYSKPLDVLWLCARHHMELHRKNV